MKITRIEIRRRTTSSCDVLDITDEVVQATAAAGIEEGMGLVFVAGSTAAITTLEYEEGLVQDFKDALERLVPRGIPYQHDARWGDGNGYSHVRAGLLGASFSFPVQHGRPVLGTWQQIVLVDLDNRPRQREVIVQLMGE